MSQRQAVGGCDHQTALGNIRLGQPAVAKRHATDMGFAVANEALQIHGGYGYLKDFPLERHVRDLRVHQILEGTNEIMRMIVARELLRQ